jgi:hypothetical protein
MIYVVRSGDLVKVGFSVRPMKRLRDLQNAHGDKLELIRLLSGTVADERRIHGQFSALRRAGEWFEACPALLEETFGLPELPLPEKPQRRDAKPLPHPEFLARVEAALIVHDIAPGIFGINVLKDPQFVFDLRKGRECRRSTIDKVDAYITSLNRSEAA